MDRAVLEYPLVRAGLILCLDRAFSYELNEIIAAKAIAWRDRGVVAVDIAGPVEPTFRFSDYAGLFAQVRRAGLGATVHAGETGGPEEVREAVEALEPTRIGHGVKAAYDPAVMDLLRERQIVLEVCVSSNLNTRVVRDMAEMRHILRQLADHGVRMAMSTDGPEMLRSYLRDEIATVLRHGILSLDEVERSLEVARQASFVDRAPVPGGARLDLAEGGNGSAPYAVEVEA
jgi:adenosine deaminase